MCAKSASARFKRVIGKKSCLFVHSDIKGCLRSDNSERRTARKYSISSKGLHQVLPAVRKTQVICAAIYLDAATDGVANFQPSLPRLSKLDNYRNEAAPAEGGRP
mgnify:CR=1 FL=1